MVKKKPTPIVEHFMRHLAPHGPIEARPLFGGYGIYYRDMMFACIIKGMLFFRIDDKSRIDFEEMGSTQFIYEKMGRPVAMPYFTLPDMVLKNPPELKKWIERAYHISLRAKRRR